MISTCPNYDDTLKTIFGFCLFLVLAMTLGGAQVGSFNDPVIGTWEGESKCLVPNSPCHDEHVIYKIVPAPKSMCALKMNGYKVVHKKRQFMSTLDCTCLAVDKTLSCTSRGKEFDDWEYTLSGDTLRGTLKIDGGKTLYREIVVKAKDD